MKLPYERKEKRLSDELLVRAARTVLKKEAEALTAAVERIDESVAEAARIISHCAGRLVVSGLGKSGHVGRKTAATFASLGVPAFFVHATEASHGDLGMVCREDVGYFLSNSGETKELLDLIPHFKRIGAPIIAVTGNVGSTLAREADFVLNTHVESEADPLGLAPTSSTTLQMAMGDAVAGMTTLLLGLAKEDFAIFHPGGTLGKKLLLRVENLMSAKEELPVVSEDARISDALFEITSKGFGATAVVDGSGRLAGIFTDGDLRRFMEGHGDSGLNRRVSEGMTASPKVVKARDRITKALNMVERFEVSVLVVVDDDGKPVGMLHVHDIIKAGVA